MQSYPAIINQCPDPVLKVAAIQVYQQGSNEQKGEILRKIRRLIKDAEDAKLEDKKYEKRQEWSDFLYSPLFRHMS